MGKKKKKVEIESEAEAEAESKSNIHESTQIESQTNLSLLNGDSHKKKKKKKIKAEKELNSEAKADEIPTVSIAIAGSIIDNAQSLELATRLAGQIARAATIFRIDEVVVFDNKSRPGNSGAFTTQNNKSNENERGAAFLVRILQYLETPQYLRKALFPKHNTLRFVGMLPPLDAPHHLRKHEWAPYREGVTLKERATSSVGTLVDVGLDKNYHAKLSHFPSLGKKQEHIGGIKCGMLPILVQYSPIAHTRHLLIAFGGLSGLEKSVEEDLKLKGKNVRDIFNLYLNTCPHQGSRTIRTEEALLISLQYFQEPITRALQGAVSC
ncbi:putative methyltransferase C9orf114 homolog isoform X3 [Durio zibethinus]|uniref:Methyltransferase C9orf114 homolog isoform X3 n=1 Tax=Durio zibethinus TaxID=66656 RepID=A0A6P6AAW4_DURZI|nr:putative methyltransferase C9orf114 homolog isoform X3 [Durio zibethinus]